VARSRRSNLARPSLGHAARVAGACCCMQGPRRQDSHTPKPRRNRPRRLSQHSRLLCSARTGCARVSRPHDRHRVADRPQRMPQFGCGQDGWFGAIATDDCARTRAAARNECRQRPHAAAVGGSARRRRAKHTAGEVDTEERRPGGGSGRSGLGGRRARRGARDVELRDLPGAVLVGLFSYPAGAHGTGY
jgi:hypothetical protein